MFVICSTYANPATNGLFRICDAELDKKAFQMPDSAIRPHRCRIKSAHCWFNSLFVNELSIQNSEFKILNWDKVYFLTETVKFAPLNKIQTHAVGL